MEYYKEWFNPSPKQEKIKYITDEQFDELMEYLQGITKSIEQGLDAFGLKGYKLTKDQEGFLQKKWKQCDNCGVWLGIDESCNCL